MDSGFKIIGLRGSTNEDDRLTSFQLIVYKPECGLASVVESAVDESDGNGTEVEIADGGDILV